MISLFLPKTNDCAVSVTSKMLKNAVPSIEPSYTLLNSTPHIDDFYSNYQVLSSNNEKKMLFGHGLPDGSAIEGMHGALLNVHWWCSNMKRYKMALFHACYGSRFFSDLMLADKYEDWVGYSEELYMLCGSVRISNIWKDIFIQMHAAITISETSLELKHALIDIYENAMIRLDELDAGMLGQLSIGHIELALQTLRTKNDYINKIL